MHIGEALFSLHCSGHRSDNFIIGLTDVSPAVTAPTLWNYDVCGQYPGVVGDGATVYLECSSDMSPRRYLIVQIPTSGNAIMNFCEIEVFVRRKSISTSSPAYCLTFTVTYLKDKQRMRGS